MIEFSNEVSSVYGKNVVTSHHVNLNLLSFEWSHTKKNKYINNSFYNFLAHFPKHRMCMLDL